MMDWPGRYVGTAAVEDDGEPFAEKLARLTVQLGAQFAESGKLETTIRVNLAALALHQHDGIDAE